jgi:hypothetical protein
MHTVQEVKRYVTHLDIVGEGQPDAFGVGVVNLNVSGVEGVVLSRPRFGVADGLARCCARHKL